MIEEELSVDIRPFQESDETDVIALWTEVFGYPAAHNDPAKVIRHKLAVQRDLFFVATTRWPPGWHDHGRLRRSQGMDLLARRRLGGPATRDRDGVNAARRARTGGPGLSEGEPASPGFNSATVAFYEKLGYSVEERVSMGKILGSASDDSGH